MKPHQNAELFDNKGALRDHLAREHQGKYPKSQVDILMKAMYRPNDGNLFGECPMYCEDQPLPSESDDLVQHVANHLLSLAIEALPERSIASSQSKFSEDDDDAEEDVFRRHSTETLVQEMSSLSVLDFESRIEIEGIPKQGAMPETKEMQNYRHSVALWLQNLSDYENPSIQLAYDETSNTRDIGDVPICVAIDKSGSTFGAILFEEIKVVQSICSLVSQPNENPIAVLPWCNTALDPIYLPKEMISLERLLPDGGTDPSCLYTSPACLQALSTCGLWFLLTDGEISNELVQDFSRRTADLQLHSISCVIILFGERSTVTPSTCNLSVGIACYAVAPDCLILFHDVPSGKLSILQAKGRFKELLPKSGNRFVQPILSRYMTWEDLHSIAYEALSRFRVASPRKVAPDQLALQDGLVVRMSDLYSGIADPNTLGEILSNEDNMKSIVIAEMTRGTSKQLLAWLDSLQQPIPQLTRDRPDVGGEAQRTLTQLLEALQNEADSNLILQLRHDLQQAHEQNWTEFQKVFKRYISDKFAAERTNKYTRLMRQHSEQMCSNLAPQSPNVTYTSETTMSTEYPEYNSPPECRNEDIEALFLHGFRRCPATRNTEFTGPCMLCRRDTVLVILLKTPPDITTTNLPHQGSHTPLAFPLAIGQAAETDIVSFCLCCDSCALYLVRNNMSPLGERVIGALPLAAIEDNKAAWLATLDISFKERYRISDLLAIFLAILDQMSFKNRNRRADRVDQGSYRAALEWAKFKLAQVVEVPETLSLSFQSAPHLNSQTRSLLAVLSDRTLVDPGDPGNSDISLLRYPIEGFAVIIRLMEFQGRPTTERRVYIFQRLVYHLTEAYFTILKEKGERETTTILDGILNELGGSYLALSPELSTIIVAFVSRSLLDRKILTHIQKLHGFVIMNLETGPAAMVYLRALAKKGPSYSSPISFFNDLKVDKFLKRIVLDPFSIDPTEFYRF